MNLFDSFLSGISQVGQLGSRLFGGSNKTPEQIRQEQQFNANVKTALSAIESVPVLGIGAKVATKTADLVLRAAVQLNSKVISPYITRPMSTVALLSDSNSPLYKKGEYEEGFQFSDIKSAYDRSAKVSTSQALTKSNLIPFVGNLSRSILATGNIDLDKVDVWDDKNIAANFDENDVGRWFTGIGDFLLGNKGIGVAGRFAAVPTKSIMTDLGVYTKSKTIEQFAQELVTPGTRSNTHMQVLADSKDIGEISDIVSKYSTNERLVSVLYETKTAAAAADIILADKGNLAALERLAATAPSDLFEISATQQLLASKFVATGRVYLPEGAAVPRLKAAFDHAIVKEPQFVKIRDAFFDESYSLTPGGRAFMPLEPVAITGAVIKAETKLRSLKVATRLREFDKMGDILETVVGKSRFVKWSLRQGENSPQGFVTFSGSRPSQAREELNAFLNSIKLFEDGSKKITTAPGVTERVADIRRRMEVNFIQSGDSITQLKALQDIDAEVGRLLMYSKGVFGEEEIANYLANYRASIVRNIESFQSVGYGIDHTGRQILTNPQTLSQLKDAYRFTPWNNIERSITLDSLKASGSKFKVGAIETARHAREVLDGLNRFWTFDVLARPMFIIKQSIAEPIVSATLAQGFNLFGYAGPMSKRLKNNLANTAKDAASRVKNKKDLKAINENIELQRIRFSEASSLKDAAAIEVEFLLRGTGSPAAARSGLSAARKNLEAADKLLDEAELGLRNSVKKFGKAEAMPNLTLLTRRLEFLKKNTSKLSPQHKLDLVDAEYAIGDYKLVVNSMAINKTVIQDADAKLAAAYDRIDSLVKEQGQLFTNRADVFGKSAEYKKRYYDEAQHDIVINGQVYSIDSFITDESAFGKAMRAEVSNAVSTENTYLNHLSVGASQARISRRVPGEPIRTSDAGYFEELAYLANRHYRSDPLTSQILANKSLAELKVWAASNEGISYLKRLDIEDPTLAAAYLQDKIGLMDRMFPSLVARDIMLKREITSNDLESALASSVDELFDIHPFDHDYGVVDFMGRDSFSKVLDKASSAVFRFMMKAENPIREMYFNEIATQAVARKAAALVDQGVVMTPARLNALRQSSVREAVENTERTFYSANRQKRIMQNARLLFAFPNATLNAFSRYGRLAMNNPIRTAQALNSYNSAFMSFGVDENGVKTNDVNKITHLVLPGSKALGEHFKLIGLSNDGFALNAKSVGFLLNLPSPSFISGFSIGTVMKSFPDSEDSIKNLINTFTPDTWNQWFPYGAPTSPVDMLTPPWARYAYYSIVGPKGKADYMSSWTSVYNYHKTMVEMGIETTFPTDKQIEEETKANYFVKAFWGFASPFGVPIKVTTSPMGLSTALYYKLKDRALSQGKTEQQAADEAGASMMASLGPRFMIDRVAYSGSAKRLKIPNTLEAYNRIFKDNPELVKTLSGIDKNKISLVGLLTSDLSNDPAIRSDNILKILSNPNLTLPGTSQAVNDLRMTPQEAEIERMKSRTWEKYNLIKDALTAKITDGKSFRSHPELKFALSGMAETLLKQESPEWYNDYMIAESGDTSYKTARALDTIINDNKFMKANGKTPFWNDVEKFMQIRQIFVLIYQALPDYDPRKARLMIAYNGVTEAYLPQWDPKLQVIIKNSFDNDTLKAVN